MEIRQKKKVYKSLNVWLISVFRIVNVSEQSSSKPELQDKRVKNLLEKSYNGTTAVTDVFFSFMTASTSVAFLSFCQRFRRFSTQECRKIQGS